MGCGRLRRGRVVECPGQEAQICEPVTAGPHFARLWEAHEVVEFRSSPRRCHHPLAGDIEVSVVRLAVREAPWSSPVCHFPVPGSEPERRPRGLVTLPG
ncbi:hypothetical protein [Streptomyces sp. NBC_01515]|uniref:MmyB family transcriptional regulator n=1 Tax=Streptomyces sp. NBC_01515 TaxID=2903890 RepID=UPI00386F8BF8